MRVLYVTLCLIVAVQQTQQRNAAEPCNLGSAHHTRLSRIRTTPNAGYVMHAIETQAAPMTVTEPCAMRALPSSDVLGRPLRMMEPAGVGIQCHQVRHDGDGDEEAATVASHRTGTEPERRYNNALLSCTLA